ncbi:hypothetical protein [Streptomyces sp. NPDC050560]|uniref:hypothetical protein n=1 Tax=Streptomyces sp. NPDC050560 TaxID=3365630 RepID=UPI0037ADD3DC
MAKNKNRKQATRPEQGADGGRSAQEKTQGEGGPEPMASGGAPRKQRRFGHN